jgi:hypothetical protein
MPNEDFVGSITVPMANYLISALQIAEFKNTNIIGDGDRWDGIVNNGGDLNLSLIPSANLGLIGDYSRLNSLGGSFYGVTDIAGSVSNVIGQKPAKVGYLNIWDNILRETSIGKFGVVYLHNAGGEYVVTGAFGYPATYASVIIYSKKYNKDALIGNATTGIGGLAPSHRAFVDGSGVMKLTDGNAAGGFDVKYRGMFPNSPIPSLDEEAWRIAGNNNTTPPNLAANYAALDGRYKWADQADLDANAVTDR